MKTLFSCYGFLKFQGRQPVACTDCGASFTTIGQKQKRLMPLCCQDVWSLCREKGSQRSQRVKKKVGRSGVKALSLHLCFVLNSLDCSYLSNCMWHSFYTWIALPLVRKIEAVCNWDLSIYCNSYCLKVLIWLNRACWCLTKFFAQDDIIWMQVLT